MFETAEIHPLQAHIWFGSAFIIRPRRRHLIPVCIIGVPALIQPLQVGSNILFNEFDKRIARHLLVTDNTAVPGLIENGPLTGNLKYLVSLESRVFAVAVVERFKRIQKGTDKKTITATLQGFGEIEHCMPPDQLTSLYRVKFKDHSAAEEATKAPKVAGLKYNGAFLAYKSVPYDDIDSGGEGRGQSRGRWI